MRQRRLVDDGRSPDRRQPGELAVMIDGGESLCLAVQGRLVQVDVARGRRRAGAVSRRSDQPLRRQQRAGVVLRKVAEHRDQVGAGLLVRGLGGERGPLVLGGGGGILVEGDRDLAEDLEIEGAARLQLQGGPVGALGDRVVLGEKGNVAQLLAEPGVVR